MPTVNTWNYTGTDIPIMDNEGHQISVIRNDDAAVHVEVSRDDGPIIKYDWFQPILMGKEIVYGKVFLIDEFGNEYPFPPVTEFYEQDWYIVPDIVKRHPDLRDRMDVFSIDDLKDPNTGFVTGITDKKNRGPKQTIDDDEDHSHSIDATSVGSYPGNIPRDRKNGTRRKTVNPGVRRFAAGLVSAIIHHAGDAERVLYDDLREALVEEYGNTNTASFGGTISDTIKSLVWKYPDNFDAIIKGSKVMTGMIITDSSISLTDEEIIQACYDRRVTYNIKQRSE